MTIRIGTAGWSLPKQHREGFPETGSLLERYSQRLNAAEINTSFYRPHKPEIYARWAAATPADFRFSVKIPKTITHEARLQGAAPLLIPFLAQARGLGDKLGAFLVQLPPSLAFDATIAEAFLHILRELCVEPIALEPRHASWFTPEADGLMRDHRVARVAADPARVPGAGEPGAWRGLTYVRLHGSPRMYASAYGEDFLEGVARRLRAAEGEAWCIFDNTLSGAALGDALTLRDRLGAD